jgi:hypothetical protein
MLTFRKSKEMHLLAVLSVLLLACMADQYDYLDILQETDLRQMLTEQGVDHTRLRSRAQLIESIIGLDNEGGLGRKRILSGAGHELKVLYCSG